jgi:hypothetical protein
LKRFVVTVEGPNLEDLEEIELPSLPREGDPIETRFGTCVVVRTESVTDSSGHEGRIVCRMP